METWPIRTFGDPALGQATKLVENIDGSVAALAEVMLATMYAAPGVGLAANQIGVQQRMFVYDEGTGPKVVINPVILSRDGEYTMEEGCLSVPGLSWEITRANRVHLQGFDLDGNPLDIETDEYEGRIFQHEVDHLDGFLLIDRLTDEQKAEAKKVLRKRRLQLSETDRNDLRTLLGD